MTSRSVQHLRSVLIVAAVMVATPLRAEPRIVVASFEGGKAARPMREVVVRVLEKRKVEVVEDRKINLGPDAGTDELVDLATKLGAEAVITGSLSLNKKKKRYVLTVAMAIDGEQGTTTLDLGRRPRLSKALKTKLERQISARLKGLERQEPAVPVAVAPPPAAPEPRSAPVEPTTLALTGPATGGAVPAAAIVQPSDIQPTASLEMTRPAAAAPPSPPASDWQNYALMRAAFPKSVASVRSFWDSRDYGALEQLLAFRTPLDFYFYARTVLRSDAMMSDVADLSTFSIEGFLWSPMIYSVGATANYSGSPGADNDAFRLGVSQSLVEKVKSVTITNLVVFLPFDSTRPGGRVVYRATFAYGPARSEIIAAYVWPAIKRIDDPMFVVLRPDLRVYVWKSLGVYTQYEYNSALPSDRHGLRFGMELSANF